MNRRDLIRVVVVAGFGAGLPACAPTTQQLAAPTETNFLPVSAPPAGMSRVYILAPIVPTIAGRIETDGRIYVATSGEPTADAGPISGSRIVAFDTAARSLVIGFRPVVSAYARMTFQIETPPGQIQIIRLNAQQSGSSFGLIGALAAAAANSDSTAYSRVDPADASKLFEGKRVMAISPEARGIVSQ